MFISYQIPDTALNFWKKYVVHLLKICSSEKISVHFHWHTRLSEQIVTRSKLQTNQLRANNFYFLIVLNPNALFQGNLNVGSNWSGQILDLRHSQTTQRATKLLGICFLSMYIMYLHTTWNCKLRRHWRYNITYNGSSGLLARGATIK